jgi:CubicO group peptidase (beta-lactamase class C family)
VTDLLDRAFSPEPDPGLGVTLAVLAVQGGEVVLERYGPETGPDTTLISWSMAKSVLHALVGILVADGRLDPEAPAPVPEWQGPDDPRGRITTEQLLRMCSGLAFREDYVDDQVSDVIEMLFGSGQADMAGFAARFPLEHEPGTMFNYSSGTSNILAGIVGRVLGGRSAVEQTLHERLFDPLGMTSATAKFDGSGTFVGSSYVYATARDFGRFGELYLREGDPVLPPMWVEHARARTPLDTGEGEQPYGAHWWLVEDGRGTFAAQGYEGQRIRVVPELDLVLVRLGKTTAELKPNLEAWLDELVNRFDRPG